MPAASDVLLDKKKVRDAAVAILEEEHKKLLRLANETKAGATHEEAKAENDKDTRSLEQSYLCLLYTSPSPRD